MQLRALVALAVLIHATLGTVCHMQTAAQRAVLAAQHHSDEHQHSEETDVDCDGSHCLSTVIPATPVQGSVHIPIPVLSCAWCTAPSAMRYVGIVPAVSNMALGTAPPIDTTVLQC